MGASINGRSAALAVACLAAASCADGGPSMTLRAVVIEEPAPPAAAPPNRPAVTMDRILLRDRASVSGLRWRDDGHLAAEIRLAGEDGPATRLIGLDGALSEPVASSGGTPSPDGGARLVRGAAGWELVDAATGAAIPVPEPDDPRAFYSLSPPVWSPDGRYVALPEIHDGGAPREPEAIAIDGVPVIDVGAAAEAREPRLSRITIIERGRPDAPRRILFDDGKSVYSVAWDAEDALYAAPVAFFAKDPYTEIVAIPPDGEEPREIYRTPGRFEAIAPKVAPDGSKIAFAVDVDNRAWVDFTSLVLIDPATGVETRVTDDLAVLGPSLVWSRDGGEIYATARSGGLDQIWAIPLDGEPRQLTSGPRRCFGLTLSPDGRRLAFETEDGYGRRDVRVLDVQAGEERVLFVADEPARELALGAWRHIRWDSTDGVRPYGFVFLPPDFDPSRKYPMLVDVHGGGGGSRLYLGAPLTLAVAPGPLEWHAWAASGYVVFVPDYRSTGDYGPDVIAARRRDGVFPALVDMTDVVTGVRHMIAQGYVDPTRVAVFGHSAGGPVAYNAVASSPSLFAAAVIHEGTPPDAASTSIWSLATYGEDGMGALEVELGAPMAKAPERYAADTMFDAARVDTPTLILMGGGPPGGMDHWPWEVVFAILRDRGTPARMLVFPEEGHVYASPDSARLAFEEMRAWLEAHMPDGR